MNFLLKCSNQFEIKIKHLPHFCVLIEPLLKEFENGGLLENVFFEPQNVDEDFLFVKYPHVFKDLSDLCGFVEIEPLSVLMNNESLIRRLIKPKSNAYTGEEVSFSTSMQTLISAGHSHFDILEYPFSVFVEYLKAVNSVMKTEISLQRFAVNASNKQFESFLKD